jgi:pilus assembly protein CpaE
MTNYIKKLEGNVIVDGVATSFEGGYELIHKKRPLIAIMEVGPDINLSLERISQILNRFPRTTIFATCADKSSETILKVMRAGAAEYLLRPVVDTDLAFALQKVGRLWLTESADLAETGRIITVFSPKGGVGSTTIAINLAANIYEQTQNPTILVDLDLNAGDVTTFLNMKPSYTMSDVTTNIARLDKSFLKGVIAKHDSGISVLAEPQKVEEGVSISSSEISRVLALLKTMFNYIVVDAESISERTTTSLKMSDTILLIFSLSLPGIRNIQRYLKFFDGLGVGRDRVKIVANRYLKKGDIKLEDAERALNHPIFLTIPNDYATAMLCLNKGVPLTVGAPRSHLNMAIRELAETVIKR